METVVVVPPGRRSYRHGDLPAALLAAGVELARAGGPEAVVLREATRRVGVSPNAAYRHFAGHHALLRAVAQVAGDQLAGAMEAEQGEVPELPAEATARARFRAVGAGYLRYAREEPGLFRTGFAAATAGAVDDAAAARGGRTPFSVLNAALDDLVEVGIVTAAQRTGAEYVAWSAVHGLSMLLVDGPLRTLEPGQADAIGRQLLSHVEAGLLAERSTGAPRGGHADGAGWVRR